MPFPPPDLRVPGTARLTAALALAGALIGAPAGPHGLSAQPARGPALTEVGFDSRRWTFVGGPATRDVVGRDTVWTVPGLALLEGVDLADGVIEFDAYSAGYPSVVFRAASAEEHERVYLRTMLSGRPGALQYAPVARGFVGWRLYPEGEAAARFDPAHRNHVRVEFQGREVRVYVNGAAAPNLVAALRRPARGGAIGVGTVIGPQRFAHFRYSALPPTVAPPVSDGTTGTTSATVGAVTQWELSPPLFGAALEDYPAAALGRAAGWRSLTADADGLVEVSRVLPFLAGEGRLVPAAARAIVTRAQAGPARLAFAYCDRAAVFLNGRRVFAGTLPGARGGDDPRLAARDTLTLDLRAGRNELVVVTTGHTYGTNGGWGFAARLVPEGRAAGGRAVGGRVAGLPRATTSGTR